MLEVERYQQLVHERALQTQRWEDQRAMLVQTHEAYPNSHRRLSLSLSLQNSKRIKAETTLRFFVCLKKGETEPFNLLDLSLSFSLSLSASLSLSLS